MTTMSIEAVIRQPLMSGHCAHPSSGGEGVESSHERCLGYNRANPERIYQPCPCLCHFDTDEVFECGACGRPIIAAPHWPLDADGDMRYTHFDLTAGRVTGEDC